MLERIWDYGFTTPGVTEKWSDNHIFEHALASKSVDSFCGCVCVLCSVHVGYAPPHNNKP